jgi:glycosyltransferase involved in cell wall biosynthesis
MFASLVITLVIIMLDRANLTKRLLSSLQTAVPEFKGQVILFDNGSQESELIEMENFINQCALPISWLKNSQNYGIGPARNRAIADVKTNWVIFLDNDIYFLSNLFEHLHYTYKKTGAHFINLPLLDDNEKDIFCLGGVFSIEKMGQSFCVSGASAYYSSSDHKSDAVLPKFFLSDFISDSLRVNHQLSRLRSNYFL